MGKLYTSCIGVVMGAVAVACHSGAGSTNGNTGGTTSSTGTLASTSGVTGPSGTGPSGTGPSGTASTGTGSNTGSGTSTAASGTASTSASTGSGPTNCADFNVVGGIFQAAEPWNTPVDQDAVSPQSSTIIAWLAQAGGWGNGNKMQIDTTINILCADASTPMKTFTLDSSCDPDCDSVTTFPVPAGGAVEGESGYACNGGGDCHLLVVDKATNKLWEMYGGFNPASGSAFNSVGGAIIWDLTKAYPPNLRGEGCTSSDAGGFPVAAMLFTADEVAAGHIDHAVRFILPNARIRDGRSYVQPATHTGVETSSVTRPNAPPYGVHFRLKASFDLTTLPNNGARTVAKAMQKYGMFLSDGGNIALTAANDQFTTAKWSDANVNLSPTDLSKLQVTDFEVVDMGTIVTTGDSCVPANR